MKPLLESVLGQQRVRWSILARDDGSRDATVSILDRHAQAGRLVYYRGAHLRPAASFLDLLDNADPACDAFAFCDQDDVWLPDKLSRAVEHLSRQAASEPALYCGRLMLVDEALTPLTLTPVPRRGPSFENALVENIAAGCTIVLNGAARNLLIRKMPDWLVAHDWWAYLVVSAFGTVVYDPQPTVLYRQHRANAVGASRSRAGSLARRLRKFRHNRAEMAVFNQAPGVPPTLRAAAGPAPGPPAGALRGSPPVPARGGRLCLAAGRVATNDARRLDHAGAHPPAPHVSA